jgi:hypothetical protein
VGWDWAHLVRRPLIGLLYQPRMIDDDDCGAVGGMRIGRGKPKYSEKTCSSANLYSINPTWLDVGSNPGRAGGKPATNRLSYGTALINGYFSGLLFHLHGCSTILGNLVNIYKTIPSGSIKGGRFLVHTSPTGGNSTRTGKVKVKLSLCLTN